MTGVWRLLRTAVVPRTGDPSVDTLGPSPAASQMDQPVTSPPDPSFPTGGPPPPPPPHYADGRTQELPVGASDPYAPPQPYVPQPYGPPPSAGPYGDTSYADATHGTPGAGRPPDGPGERAGLRGWHLAAAALLALVVGLGVGIGVGSGSDDGEEVAALEAEVDRLWDELQVRDGEVAALSESLERTEGDLAAAEAEAQAARDEAAGSDAPPAPEASEEPADDEPADGTPADGEYLAGSYTFADVQVSEDFLGHVQVRTRMTNTGEARNSVAITATLSSGGSVVGTAIGFAVDVASGATITLHMLSTDVYTGWDEIEFQVDLEF